MAKSEESLESKETPPEEKPVGDEELDSAAQTTEEEEVKVEPKKETKKQPEPEEEEDHRERSKLGRKVKQLEDVIQQQNERMEMLMNKLEKPHSPVEEEDVPEDVAKWFAAYERKKGTEQQRYSQGYLKSFWVEGKNDRENDPELYDEIYKEMATNFNVRYSNDPSMDAAINYGKAARAVLKKQTASVKSKPNVKADKPQASTSLDVKSRSVPEPSEDEDLDPEAREFVKKIGMSRESVREALKGPGPAHLSKK